MQGQNGGILIVFFGGEFFDFFFFFFFFLEVGFLYQLIDSLGMFPESERSASLRLQFTTRNVANLHGGADKYGDSR